MVTQLVEPTDAGWKTLSSDEKLDRRIEAWLSPPDIKFASPEAEEAYKGRVRRIIDAIRLKKTPDRAPVLPSQGGFHESYCGYTRRDVMYDVEKAIDVANRVTLDFQFDTKISANAQPGKVNDILDDKMNSWPGHGLPLDADGLQYLEAEYMKADEYDAFFEDPTNYRLRILLPRMWGAAEPLAKLMPMAQGNIASFVPFALPEVKAAMEKLAQAGQETLAWQRKTRAANRHLTELGFPSLAGGGGEVRVPFALFSDRLRGTRGIMIDMLRQPGKLLEAMERLVPIHIKRCISTARLGESPIVSLHLHKGADRFMSAEQFKTFYWGPARKIILGVIQEGLIVEMRLEGGFNSRLETMRDGLPKGKTLWFLQWETDTARAKEIAGDVACMAGNVPASLIYAGTPEEIVAYCRNLIKVAGKGGGYMFAMPQEGILRTTKVENVWAMIKTAKKYGVYS